MDGRPKRDLDVTNSTIDVAALNNVVVSMRTAVKGAKIFTVRKLSKNLQALKKKKGFDDQQEKLKQKAERIVKEIMVIKRVKPDKVSKFALAKTETFEEICRKHPNAIETRALARLSENKFLVDKVKKFREEHEDWKELAAFILSKNTGRRFKKNPGPEVQIDVEKVLLESQRELQQQKTQIRDGDGDEDSSEESDDAASEDGDGSEKDETSHPDADDTETGDNEITEHTTNSSKHDSDKLVEDKSSKKKNTEERKKEKTGKEQADIPSSPDKEIKPQTVRSREMAIKRLNLDEMKDGEIDVDEQKDVPSFLVSPSGGSKKSEAKPKSKFFMCESDSENSEEDEAEIEDEEEREGEDELDDTELQEKNRMRAKDAINSTFLGSLSSVGRKQLEKRDKRNINDYKKMRQERPQQRQNWTKPAGDQHGHAQQRTGKFKSNKNSDNHPSNFKGSKKEIKTTAPSVSEDKELHPSWEASRKRKQQMSQIQPFQGKKIKFDDD